MAKKRLLWIGDAAVPSGFARATHETLDVMRQDFDVTVLGINYRGDPHSYPYPIYAAMAGGDWIGVGRLHWMCDLVNPDVIVMQNDPWHIPVFLKQLARVPEHANIPMVAAIAVDGKNCKDAKALNGLALAIFWTEFGERQARLGGYTGPSAIIPLGVSTEAYYRTNKQDARMRRGIGGLSNTFIVGNVNRNQPRKRIDLTIKYFAEWVHQKQVTDAYLFLHVAPTGETGADIEQLARYYGIIDRLALMEPATWYGIEEDEMRDTYNCFDVQVTTTQGEGFGLTTFEGMACGVPQIVPAWSALGELTKGAAWQVKCDTTAIGPPYVNVIGGVPNEEEFIEGLDRFYNSPESRAYHSEQGLALVNQSRFRWENVGRAFNDAVLSVVETAVVGVPV